MARILPALRFPYSKIQSTYGIVFATRAMRGLLYYACTRTIEGIVGTEKNLAGNGTNRTPVPSKQW
jgi:hypothetical protein